jgi:hypothetical protein
MSDTLNIPHWFRLAVEIATLGVSKDPANIVSPFKRLSPEEAVDLVRQTTNASVQQAGLLYVCTRDYKGKYASTIADAMPSMFATWQLHNGRSTDEMRNSQGAIAIRQTAGQWMEQIRRTEAPMILDTPHGNAFETARVRASIDLAGLQRRGLEGIVNPKAAGLGIPNEGAPKQLTEARRAIEDADAELGAFGSISPATVLPELHGKLRSSINFERHSLTVQALQAYEKGLVSDYNIRETSGTISSAYRSLVAEAQQLATAGRKVEAGAAYAQAGVFGHYTDEVSDGEVIVNYEKGTALLLQDRGNDLAKNWLANIQDHAPALINRYPAFQDKINAMINSIKSPDVAGMA